VGTANRPETVRRGGEKPEAYVGAPSTPIEVICCGAKNLRENLSLREEKTPTQREFASDFNRFDEIVSVVLTRD